MRPLRFALGALLLTGAVAWLGLTLKDLNAVSPLHWPRMAPAILLGVPPAGAATAAGILLLARNRAALVMLVALGLTLGQAVTALVSQPELRSAYRLTVQEASPSAYAPAR